MKESHSMSSVLERLLGESLSEVRFVMDYVQLVFDGQLVTMLVWPQIEVTGEKIRSGADSGYRDSLCSFITHAVRKVEESSTTGIALQFDIGVLRILLRETDLTGPEIALYASGP